MLAASREIEQTKCNNKTQDQKLKEKDKTNKL